VAQHWKLYEAKNKLSELIDKSISQEPQVVTRRGEEVVVVLSTEEYGRLRKTELSLVDFFRSPPLMGVELDLERDKTLPRDVE